MVCRQGTGLGLLEINHLFVQCTSNVANPREACLAYTCIYRYAHDFVDDTI